MFQNRDTTTDTQTHRQTPLWLFNRDKAEYEKVSNTEMFGDGDHLPTAGTDGGGLCGQLHCLHTQEERCPVRGQQHQPSDVPPHVHQLLCSLCKVGIEIVIIMLPFTLHFQVLLQHLL